MSLYITRKPGEFVKIINKETKEEIWLDCIEIKGKQVTLGIDAPRRYKIRRTDDERGNPPQYGRLERKT